MRILLNLSRYLRTRGSNGLGLGLKHPAIALTLMLLLPLSSSAYTLVMRSGRQVLIPASFTVTRTSLTFEAAPGLNITLQLASIDITATERVNREAAGSFLKRAEQSSRTQRDVSAQTPSGEARARRTITNRDLEASRRARDESEAAYERRLLELGLPSLAEVRRRQQEEVERLSLESSRREVEEAQAESYWRERASGLRTELVALDAEISYISSLLNSQPRRNLTSSYTVFNTGGGQFYRRRPFMRQPSGPLPPRVIMPGNMRPQTTGGVLTGGAATHGQVPVNAAPASVTARGRGHTFGPITGPSFIAPPFGLYAGAYPSYQSHDASYERTLLITRLNELASARAGLLARWRLLEEEARRAGAPPGWLRPY